MKKTDRGLIFIVSGPSGSGKSTVLHHVFEKRDRLYFSISATTRRPRPGEIDGEDYYFLSKERFKVLCDDGELLEHAEYAGNYYGTPRGPIENKLADGFDVIMDIDIQGARQVKAKLPEVILIFIAPPSMEELEYRLRGRSTESEEKILCRLETARSELSQSDFYDFVVINDDVLKASEEVLDIIEKAHKQN